MSDGVPPSCWFLLHFLSWLIGDYESKNPCPMGNPLVVPAWVQTALPCAPMLLFFNTEPNRHTQNQLRPPRTSQPGRARGCPSMSHLSETREAANARLQETTSILIHFRRKAKWADCAKPTEPLEHVLTQRGPRRSPPLNSSLHTDNYQVAPVPLEKLRILCLFCPHGPCAELPNPHARPLVGEDLQM